MYDKIRAYIDQAFEDVLETQRVRELKEEIFSNLIEKYNEEIAMGKSDQDAYNAAIAGLGDLSEVVDSVRVQPLYQPSQRERGRRAIVQTVAIMLYILSVVPAILFTTISDYNGTGDIGAVIGVVIMLVMVAIATGLIIYNHSTRPTYAKRDDTIVEDFKEWRVNSDRSNWKKAYKSFSGAFWLLIVCIYLLTSFVFHTWAWSWILFIVAAAIDNIIKGILALREDRK